MGRMVDPKTSVECEQKKKRFAFDLRLLFYVVSLFAAGMAFSISSIGFTLFVLFFWGCCFAAVQSANPRQKLWFVAFGFLFLPCLIGMLLPAVSQVREAARRTACANNMRQVGLSLLNYESANGSFPKAINGTGQNQYSWRIEVLPYLEQQKFAQAYDKNQPWYSTKNMQWAQNRLESWSCPSRSHGPKTPYKLVTGPGTVFEDGESPTIAKITDGTSNTIILIEDHTAPVFLSDPNGDIHIDDAVELLSQLNKENCLHRHEGTFTTSYVGTHVVLADGSIRTVRFGAESEQIRRAFLCTDGLPVEQDVGELGERIVVVKWGAVVLVGIYGILIVLPIFPLIRQCRQNKQSTIQVKAADDEVETNLRIP